MRLKNQVRQMINLPPYPQTPDSDWAGLTLDEIRMRRALVQARMEIQKYKLNAQIEGMRERTPLFGGSSSLFSRLTGALSFAEYAFLAVRLFRMVSPIFKKKK